ncbi:hypothetical protein VD0002_g8405 [Verticillium dahliae]|uniref:Importin N-terminal domain-containing protein n=1 Tax=Verticillium dahliae TaxID=27337 RepID=A0AA44WJF0_VERDA|nr:hypothetical protein BJF96_g4259 [Verticillium dahliae]PNH59128.1 hypothetical protein VD0002_g8405 [Verticillium dahliae]RBQ66944.1 hypothetical protein VDGD_00922 [Verticillium dahliae]
MSFAIEVPGTANPLTLQELCRALESATGADHAQRQTSGQQLEAWEKETGYYSSLQSIFLDKSLPRQIRFLAVIQLKNGIDKYWRIAHTSKGGLSLDEKNLIRQKLFPGTLDEEDEALARQNSLAAARIVRVDYPRQWPEALPSLIALLRSSRTGQPQHLHGTLQILLQVVKEMSTARLRSAQTALHSITPEIAYVLGEIYAERIPVWVDFLTGVKGQDGASEADIAIRITLLTLKVIRRLLISGFEAPHKDKTVQQFWTLSQNHFGQFLGFVSQESAVPESYQELVGKHLLQFTKLHMEMATSQPTSFAGLPSSLPLIHAYWDLVAKFAEVFDKSEGIRQSSGDAKSKAEGPLLEKLTTRALLLIKACLDLAFLPKHTFVYRGPEAKKEEHEAVEFIKNELFKDDFCLQIANTVLTHLFVFRQSDLEAWDEDPEEWEHQERFDSSAYEWEVRPAAERVFLGLLNQRKTLLVPHLLSYIQTATGGQADFATKDAVYTAMGLASQHIFQEVDFNSFLTSTLVPDAQQTGPLAKVLRRRISMLLGQWVFHNVSNESRAIVYGIFRHFMDPNAEGNDIVVLISAARNLQMIVDELDFSVDNFVPHAPHILEQLTQLIRNVSVDETRLALLETMRLVVTRLEAHVTPFADSIVGAIVEVFQVVGNQEFMAKTAIVAVFSALVTSMGTESQRFHPLMVPLITEVAHPTSELHTSLIDDVLDLWNSILSQSSPPVSTEIVSIAPLLLPILEYSPETAGMALEAVEAYIILAPGAVLEDTLRRPFLTALSGALEVKSREQVNAATRCIEYLIRAAEEYGGANGVSVVIRDMLETGFLKKILERLHDAWEAHQTTGPNKKSPKLNTVTEGDYFAILARLAYADPTLFVNMLASFGDVQQQVWPWLTTEWFSYMESWDRIEHKKLTLLGLTRLTELPNPVQDLTLGKLQDYMSLWADTIAELQDGAVDGSDNLVWAEQEGDEWDTPKSIRARELYQSDPLHRVVAKQFVMERVRDLVQRAGGEQKFQDEWMVNVDKEVVQKFAQFVSS